MAKVLTTHGEMDEELLDRRVDGNAVEYWFEGELVHRSATVGLTGVEAVGIADLGMQREVTALGYRWTMDPPLTLRKEPR